jgi:hypothetical protein
MAKASRSGPTRLTANDRQDFAGNVARTAWSGEKHEGRRDFLRLRRALLRGGGVAIAGKIEPAMGARPDPRIFRGLANRSGCAGIRRRL